MRRKTVATSVLVLLGAGLALAGGPTWTKWDVAKQQASATLKPIFVYSTVTEKA